MSDFAEDIHGWDFDGGEPQAEYERLLAAYRRAISERDALQGRVDGLQTDLARIIDERDHAVFQRGNFLRERDEARAGIELLKEQGAIAARQRDEARTDIKQVREALQRCQQWQGQVTTQLMEGKRLRDQMRIERDEARSATREVIHHARISYACRETLDRWQAKWPWLGEGDGWNPAHDE